ncbi:hypothetical protein GCM10009087_27380 [Sphingomonas oligophenolica]
MANEPRSAPGSLQAKVEPNRIPLAIAAAFSDSPEGVGEGIGVGVGEGAGVGPGAAPLAEEEPPPAQAVSTMPAAIIRLSRRDIPAIDPSSRGAEAPAFAALSDTGTMMAHDQPCQ